METRKQGYWAFEYWEHKEVLCDTESNRNYCNFAKRQYHKARRRHDEELIQEQLKEYDYRYCDYHEGVNIYDPLVYENDMNLLSCYREHNHKYTLGMTGFDGELRFV